MESNKLLKYIGWICSELTINTIEYEFYPYKLLIFYDLQEYNRQIYMYKTIRCLVENNCVTHLKIN